MTFSKYVRKFDAELQLETTAPNTTHPDVAEAQKRKADADRERRVKDVGIALEWLRNNAKEQAGYIKTARRDRDAAQKRMESYGTERDRNRLGLALVLTTADLTPAQRFGVLAFMRHECSAQELGAAYDIDVPDQDRHTRDDKIVGPIMDAATKLVSAEELEALCKAGY